MPPLDPKAAYRGRDLLEPGALQKAMLDSSALSVIAVDAAGVVQVFNAGAERMLGYARAEVQGKLTPHDLCDGYEAVIFAASRGNEDRYEVTFVRKDGSRFPAVVCVAALRAGEAQIVGYLLIAIDKAARRIDPPGEAPAVENRSRAFRLLYVDNQPASVALVEHFVSARSDVALVRAADASAALKLARAERPGAILLNLELPGLDAIAFMKRVRAEPATRNTPIIALSARDGRDDVTKGLEAGFFHYLTEPLAAAPFLDALQEALEFVARERAEEDEPLSRAAHSH